MQGALWIVKEFGQANSLPRLQGETLFWSVLNCAYKYPTRVQGAIDVKGLTNADGRMDARESAGLLRGLGEQPP